MKSQIHSLIVLFMLIFWAMGCDKAQTPSTKDTPQTVEIVEEPVVGHDDALGHFNISKISYAKNAAEIHAANFEITFSYELKNNTLSGAYTAFPQKASLLYFEKSFLINFIKTTHPNTFQQIRQIYTWEQSHKANIVKGKISLYGIPDKKNPTLVPIALPNRLSLRLNIKALKSFKDFLEHAVTLQSIEDQNIYEDDPQSQILDLEEAP